MSNKKIKIGMLRSSGNPGSRALAMSYIGQHKGVEIYFFNINDVNVLSKKISAKKLVDNSWVEEEIDYPLVIDNDNNTSLKNKEKFYELQANCYLTTQVLGGKLKTLQLLKDNNIFSNCLIPQKVIRNRYDFISFLNEYDRTVLKPIKGNQGENIYFISVGDDGFYVNFNGKNEKINNLDFFYDEVIKGKNFIIQKYINSTTVNGAAFDVRVHVQRGDKNKWYNTKTYVRVGTGSNMTSNIATGGSIANASLFIKNRFNGNYKNILDKINVITRELPELFQQFYEKNIDALGIDLGIDNDGNLWIFEINSFPGSKFFELEEASIRIDYLKYLYDLESRKKSLSFDGYLDLKNMWSSNIIIDSQIDNNKNNIAILRSLNSKLGVSSKFILNNINNIDYILSDYCCDNLPKDKIIFTRDKENTLILSCLSKREKVKPFVYSIIGSVGKTSVLALLSRSLRKIELNTYVNDFGNTPFYIAKGILSSPMTSKNWVFEVAGASNFREEPISVHSHKMLQPNICIFTNIAEAHIGEIGSLEEIAIMKSKSLANIANDSIVVMNGDMPYQNIIKSNINPKAKVYTFGLKNESDFCLKNSADNILKFVYNNNDYEIIIPTDVSIEIKLNFLSVAASLMLSKKDWHIACNCFKDWRPVKGRGNLEQKNIKDKKITIINDSYNANPTSMKLAISSLNKKTSLNKKVAVLGEIAELGDHNDRIHKEILNYLKDTSLDKVILIGKSYTKYLNYYKSNPNYFFYENIDIFKDKFENIVEENDLVLFKGSHSSMLYDFLNKI